MAKRIGRRWGLAVWAIGGLGSAALLGGCFPTPEGCNAFDSGDECAAQDQRCNEQGVHQRCGESPCGNYWIDDACGADEPICFSLGTSPARGSRAECVSDAHCGATSDCARAGLCADSANGCVATKEGCAKACRDGFCGFDGTSCVPTDDGCAKAPFCAQRGQCVASAIGCVASAAGCTHSDSCKNDGLCGFVEGSCVVSAEGCAASSACMLGGFCTLKEGVCSQ